VRSRRNLWVWAALGAACWLAACGPKPVEYATLADARAAGAIDAGALPDVLPPSAALIRAEKDPQDGRAEGFFHFSSTDYAPLVARLSPLAAPPADPQVVAWIQRKQLADYTAYEFKSGARAWLLLCAQNKGRCYFRTL
jgi:hypothetical protein